MPDNKTSRLSMAFASPHPAVLACCVALLALLALHPGGALCRAQEDGAPPDAGVAATPECTVPLCGKPPLYMTLEECVALVMRRNVNIRIAYLDRVLQKYDLVTDTYYTFAPRVSVDGNLTRRSTDVVTDVHVDSSARNTSTYTQTHSRQLTDSYGVTPRMAGLIPTGARYTMSWGLNRNQEFYEEKRIEGIVSSGWVPTRRRGLESDLRISISQPLLKGAGLDYNLATVRRAVLDEKINVLNLKNGIISELTTAIRAYRSLLSAKWSVAISENSLQRARENLELARAKIDIGRMAPVDVLQFEADEANRELSLAQALDSYNTARLELLKLLDLDRGLCIEPVEELEFHPMDLEEERLEETVFETRPEYLSSLLRLKKSEIDLLRAQRDRLWDLSLDAEGGLSEPDTYVDARGEDTSTTTTSVDWSIGLNLNIPVFGEEVRNLRRNVLQAKSSLHIERLRLRKQQEDILSELEQQLSNLELLERQMELAHRSRILEDRKLEVEQIKLQKGMSSTFQLVTFQDQQFQARQAELSARISYLNALADLDSFLGTTMETWGIEFRSYRKQDEAIIGAVTREGQDIPDNAGPDAFEWGVELPR